MRERRVKYPDIVRRNWEKSVYGVCKEDFDYNFCWVCGSNKRLSIDHNHKNGKVRGLLCGKCNIALGLLEDDIFKIKRLAAYIEENS